MSTPLPVGPNTPYVTPELLLQAPTGVSFSSIPAGANVSPAAKNAAVANICQAATAMVDLACNQPLRATIDTLLLYTGGPRVGLKRGRPAELIMTRWPVLEVLSIEVAPNSLPYVFSPVPATAYQPKYPVVGLYGSSAPGNAAEGGQTILLDPQYLTGYGLSNLNGSGRGWGQGCGYAIQVQDVNGWPHCGLTAPSATGDAVLQVDDCTGWVITSPVSGGPAGATGTVYDAAVQEIIQVTAASATSGPGTLVLAAPLTYAHAAGVMVSTLPQTVVWAATLFGAAQALTRGATSTTIRQIPPGSTSSGGERAASLKKQATDLLASFARII